VASGLQGFGSHRAELSLADEYCLCPLLRCSDRVRFVFGPLQGRKFLR